MAGDLKKVLTAPGVLERLDYRFFPWGNAYFNVSACSSSGFDKEKMFCWVKECGGASAPSGCFEGVKLCQHGEPECAADTLEACAMAVYPKPEAYTPFVTCFEGAHESKLSAAPACAKAAGLNYTLISACAADENRTKALDAANAKATAALGASKIGTPWVLLQGKHVETDGLLKQVCDAIGSVSSPPAGCATA